MHNHQHPLEPSHGGRLADDLPLLAAQVLKRRRALAWLSSSAGIALLGGCGGGGGSDASSGIAGLAASATNAAATPTTSTASPSTTTTTTSTASSSDACVADPSETAGPYPADGTNVASGSTSDVLTASGIVRSDIRPSFLGTSTIAQGVVTTLKLTLVNTNASCALLSGYAVYLWHCDASGNYSLYSAPAESYLRGVQVSDALGQVTFTTIFPACYSGRWPHIHFEIFGSLAAATTGKNAILTSQLALPAAACSTVYAGDSAYSRSVANLAAVSLATDNVFGDNTAAQIAAMTPVFTGSVSSGYAATATIGIAV